MGLFYFFKKKQPTLAATPTSNSGSPIDAAKMLQAVMDGANQAILDAQKRGQISESEAQQFQGAVVTGMVAEVTKAVVGSSPSTAQSALPPPPPSNSDPFASLSESQVTSARDRLLAELNSHRTKSDCYATTKAIAVIRELTNPIPEVKREDQQEQILEDLAIYPLWEAATLAIKEYVPWGESEIMSHDESIEMDRILLTVASHSAKWLSTSDPSYVTWRIQ